MFLTLKLQNRVSQICAVDESSLSCLIHCKGPSDNFSGDMKEWMNEETHSHSDKQRDTQKCKCALPSAFTICTSHSLTLHHITQFCFPSSLLWHKHPTARKCVFFTAVCPGPAHSLALSRHSGSVSPRLVSSVTNPLNIQANGDRGRPHSAPLGTYVALAGRLLSPGISISSWQEPMNTYMKKALN